jgi:hypothetical protein
MNEAPARQKGDILQQENGLVHIPAARRLDSLLAEKR